MSPDLLTRIAPTPSGFLHLGNAYNFLLNEEIAKQKGASLRLRIDDLDTPRIRPEYVEDIFESFAWLAIQPDCGPQNTADHEAHFSQTRRLPAYSTLLEKLAATGLVFACACSRKDLERTSEGGQYTGACIRKNIPLNTPDVAWRIQTPPESAIVHFHDGILGYQRMDLWDVQRHFIVRRRDGLAAYHVASLSDDAAYGINLIVRGEDLLMSTGAQLYLADLLWLQTFYRADFYHHPLLPDARGGKLSKSAGSTSLKALRENGKTVEDVRSTAALWWKAFL